MSAVAQDEEKIEMSNHEKFLFDLNGFIVLRNVLNEEEVQQLNDAIDANIHKAVSRETAGLKKCREGLKTISGGQQGRSGRMLGWDAPHGDAFRRLLVHRKLAPYITALCGEGYRLDHHPLVILQGKNSEGFRCTVVHYQATTASLRVDSTQSFSIIVGMARYGTPFGNVCQFMRL